MVIAQDKAILSTKKHSNFSYFSMKTFGEVLLMTACNKPFHAEIRKIMFWVLLLSEAVTISKVQI